MKNKGKSQHRFSREPLEKRFAETWEAEDNAYNILEYILSDNPNEREPVAQHHREVAATVIQWLGSPCGMAFLSQVLKFEEFKKEKELKSHIRSLNEDQG